MKRFFYVDAARSITSKEGKKYWKCSVVENGVNILNFANGKTNFSVEAEAFTILKTVFYLVEQKYQGEVDIYSDCLGLTGYWKTNNLAERMKENQAKKPKKYTRKRSKSRALEFLLLTKTIAWKNNLKLKIKWVKGKENPADYYSRVKTPDKRG